jgi:hypothetical protein
MRRVVSIFLARSALISALSFLILAGCQQLFTTSLGSALARDSLPIPATLSVGQAGDLAAQAKGDPKLAAALVSSLVTQISATADPDVAAGLMGPAASAAIDASGTSGAIMGTIKDFMDTGDPPTLESLQTLLATIQEGASGAGVLTALAYLDPSTGLSQEQAEAAGLGATDLAIAAIVLAASVIPPGSDPADAAAYFAALTDPTEIATIDAAKNILAEAQALAGSDPNSSSLLDMIAGNFSLSTTP